MLTILLFFLVIQSNNKKLSFGIHWDMKVAALQKKYITHMHDQNVCGASYNLWYKAVQCCEFFSIGKPRRNSKDALKTVLKSDSLVSYPGNKIIVEKTGTYVIFIALTQTSIRQGDVSVCIIRFREKEEKLLRVSMQTRRGILTYNAAHVSEVFHLKSGDSIVIQMKGEENLYTLKESNYFGLYRVS